MALPTYYSAGTVTLAAGGTAVTGVGTAWMAVLQPGDLFTNASGLMVRIASIESDTALTLARPWPGAAIAGSAYEIQLTPRSVGVQEATRQLLLMLSNGNLSSIAGLASAADKMPYFTGSGTAGLASLTSLGRAIIALSGGANGKIPVITGTSAAALRDIAGSVSQSGGVPTGALMEYGSNANGYYMRSADGIQICWVINISQDASLAVGGAASGLWTFPAAFLTGASLAVSASARSSSTQSVTEAAAGRLRCATGPTGGYQSYWAVACENTSISSVRVDVIAIGRWF